MSTSNFEALKTEFSERSRPIIFWTGAGVSAPSIPMWNGLRDLLLRALKSRALQLSPTDKAAALGELAQIAYISDMWLQFDRIESSLGKENYVRIIKECLGVSEKAEIPLVQQKIWEMNPTGVVTLNLDLFTQRASTAHPKRSVPISILPGKFAEHINSLKERRPFIAYPHGHLDDPRSWTFKKGDLSNRLSDSDYIEWLKIIFRAATVVFVGITADDIAIGSPIEKITSNQIPLVDHYWITSRDDLAAETWAGNHGVRILRYENRSRVHSELIQLLKDLSATVTTEDAAKETPVFPKNSGTSVEKFPPPDELALRPHEDQRLLLNEQAKFILQGTSKDKETQYQKFLDDYDVSVHAAWYASTRPGKNRFFGYFLHEEIDGGAFGTVYKGADDSGKQVAVKILKSENLRRGGFQRSFRRGANSHKIITERSVSGAIEFIDAAEIPPTIIMDWSDGTSLAKLVESGRVDNWNARVFIALQLARTIRTCHGLPERVFHRDLRPANILIENDYDDIENWRVVVLDFDLSWHKGAEDHSIMHSPAFGYLAPEQRSRGKYPTRNALVDSYGVGMTLYFLCTGNNPFPDQHKSPSWSSDIHSTLERSRFAPWLSLPTRMARLIINSTLNDQPSRLSMNQIEGELEALMAVQSSNPECSLTDLIAEELACRTEHFHGYQWIDSESCAKIASASGLNYSLQSIPGTRNIKLSVDWLNSGAQDWSHIDRMLSQAVPKLEEALKPISEATTLSKGKRAFNLVAMLDADIVMKDVGLVSRQLDKALKQASAIASF